MCRCNHGEKEKKCLPSFSQLTGSAQPHVEEGQLPMLHIGEKTLAGVQESRTYLSELNKRIYENALVKVKR